MCHQQISSAVAAKTKRPNPRANKSEINLSCVQRVFGLNEPVTVQHRRLRSLFCVLNERRLRARTPPVFGSISGVSFLKFRQKRVLLFCPSPQRDLDIDVERRARGENFQTDWVSRARGYTEGKPGEHVSSISPAHCSWGLARTDFIAARARRVDTSVSAKEMESVSWP